MTVAVGAGSRGLVDRVGIAARRDQRACATLGAEPFVVPAMGSHGGATAEGQRAMLESARHDRGAIGCEIRATMETVEVARTADGMPLYLDRNAAGADRIMPVNRIKPHTCFKGPIESGCTKMAVVGFGKQPGAAQIHACGPVEMRDRLLDGIAALKTTGRLLGGVGSLESADGRRRRACGRSTADEVGGEAEIELTDYARDLVPPLPFAEIDVLIIEQGGKDISGTTMDPNVTGRFWVHGLADSESPRVSTIVLLGITEVGGRQRARASGSPTSSRRRWPAGSTGRRPTSTASRPARRACAAAGCRWCCRPRTMHQGGAQHVRQGRRRAEARRAHPQHAAPDAVLGQRRPAVPAARRRHHRLLEPAPSRIVSDETRARKPVGRGIGTTGTGNSPTGEV